MGGDAAAGTADRAQRDAAASAAGAAETSATPALEARNLTHAFGARKALDDVSLVLSPGEFGILLGPNGAGKTTLFALATRLYHGQRGEIRVFGHDLRRHSSAALARIGVVFQQPTLDLDLTVRQNLLYHAALHGIGGRDAAARIDAELGRVEMTERLGDKVRQLSVGQRRRVEFARAMLHRPALLLLDEATAGLDVASRRYLLERVRRACREQGLAVLWATHLIEEAVEDASVVILHRGRVLARGRPAEIAATVGAPDLETAFRHLTEAGRA